MVERRLSTYALAVALRMGTRIRQCLECGDIESCGWRRGATGPTASQSRKMERRHSVGERAADLRLTPAPKHLLWTDYSVQTMRGDRGDGATGSSVRHSVKTPRWSGRRFMLLTK